MKKNLILVLLLAVCVSLSSCINTRGPLPYGTWENATLGIQFDINSNNDEFLGTYNEGGKDIEIYVAVSNHSKEFSINKITDKARLQEPDSYLLAIFDGSYKVKDDKLYYTLSPYWQESTGIKDTIVFEKVNEE